MAGWLLLVALALAGLGLWLLIRARMARRETGLPVGRVTYVDTGAWNRCERPLFSRQHRLTGRPDYLVTGPAGVIPVEVKSGAAPSQPYPAHLLQLAAYCLLVEEQEGRMPPYGLLKYASRGKTAPTFQAPEPHRGQAFEVDYTPALRAQVVAALQAMRRDLHASDVDRSHDEPRRCLGCGYREQCEQRLA